MPGSGTTPAQGFPIPTDYDDPNIPDDVGGLARAIERRVIGIYPTAAERNAWTAAAGIEEGMFAYQRDTNTLYYFDGGTWQQYPPRQPQITSSGSVPSNSVGQDGDIHFRV